MTHEELPHAEELLNRAELRRAERVSGPPVVSINDTNESGIPFYLIARSKWPKELKGDDE